MRRLLMLSSAVMALAVGPALGQPEDPVVAKVNGSEILKSEVEAAHQTLPDQYKQMPLPMIYQPLLERLIDGRLLAEEAAKRDLESNPAAMAVVERAKADALRDFMLEQAIVEGSTPDRLKAAYDALKAQPGFSAPEVHARHILVPTEDQAKQVIGELDGGGDFTELAKQRSTDPSAKSNAGDLGFFKQEAMVPEFSQAAFAMAPGTYSKAPVKSQFGWHVIRVEERREVTPSFEEKRPELQEQVARDIVTALLEGVRKDAAVERFNLDGTPQTAQ
jgi:peptidyl-prolyl cis-trans isomerase C